MTTLPFINAHDEQHSQNELKSYYEAGLIPPEKKAYLSQLRDSIGPYMGMASSDERTAHYMLDAASQIATLGLGFNPGSFFGTAHFQESWTNDKWTPEVHQLRAAFERFFKRKLQWPEVHTTFCHSGAEANEIALGYSYQFRALEQANKVLAFEGSFHGRMMISLSSTWNPDKRVPFEWPGHETTFNAYPELPGSEVNQECPAQWRETWDQASLKSFSTPKEWHHDELLKEEVRCLLQVRENLLTKKFFAILIEPMQCEGGDRYASDRFHTALLLMAQAFQVPVIYDEVQTGFHLGREFFWHKQFNLTGPRGETLSPSYVVCAKKAQIGLVISHCEMKNIDNESFSVASMIRGYHHAIALDQAQKRILELERKSLKKCLEWQKKYPQHLERSRALGMSFAIDLKDKAHVGTFIAERFKYGLLYYPAGDKTLRFRLNVAFTDQDIDLLFEQLHLISEHIFHGKSQPGIPLVERERKESPRELYHWQEFLLRQRVEGVSEKEVMKFLESAFIENCDGQIQIIDKSNFSSFKDQIKNLQDITYEPARRTEIEKFEAAAHSQKGIGLALSVDGKLEGIAFAAPLSLFPLERGLRSDPHFEDDNTLYMLDTTLGEKLRGQSTGRYLKYALTSIALARGITRLQGRNRDRLASSMLSINLSLGSYEQRYIEEDYPDFEDYRDVIYYTNTLKWTDAPLRLSHAIDMPLSRAATFEVNWMNDQLAVLNNKVCLSNFVSKRFLEDMKGFSELLPTDLRHLYSASGQSEAVDKVAKSIWYFSDKKSFRMLTFKGHEFGRGSFLSRSLSQPEGALFPVTQCEHPTMDNFCDVLDQVHQQLKEHKFLAVWVEPLLQKTMQKVPEAFLLGLKKLCADFGVKLIFNETASSSYRYHPDFHFLSCDEEFRPDAGIVYCSGQSAVVFLKKELFLEKPLMLISTWDGDEFSFAQYMRSAKFLKSKEAKNIREQFQKNLIDLIHHFECEDVELENGVGSFQAKLPSTLAQFFLSRKGRVVVNANLQEMNAFNQYYPELKARTKKG